MKIAVFSFLFILLGQVVGAQPVLRLIITTNAGKPLAGATVSGRKQGWRSDENGEVPVAGLAAGVHRFSISFTGYQPLDTSFMLPDTVLHVIMLQPAAETLEEVVVLSSTRNNQRIENSPLKVEVLGAEEMNEENTIKPGNIASILGDISGIQIQQSSAVSGNANVRIQGLDGRYTQVLRDGMPLFDGFSGGFGILTIPPLDLKQAELVKGSASTLYGGGAIGGLINLISKKPTFKQEGILTLNQSTLFETNFNTYVARRNQKAGYNLFAGYTKQGAADVNKDGLSDVSKGNTVIVHPRLFLYPSKNTSIALGYTGSFDRRTGGDMKVIKSEPSAAHVFFETNNTARHTTDLQVSHQFGDGNKLELKASTSLFNRDINTNTHRFTGNQLNYYSELALLVPKTLYNLVAGINATGDKFSIGSGDPVALKPFSNQTFGAFAQYTRNLPVNTTLELGLRGDHHATYGNFLLPRVAVFHRFNEAWATRLGTGFGYKLPNPLSSQNVEYSIEDLKPLPPDIKAERSVGYNAEINFKKDGDRHRSFFINHAFFLTRIGNPVVATQQADGKVNFANRGSNITSMGTDTYVQMTLDGWELYLGYTFTSARRNYLQQNQWMPLTPCNRFASVIVYEPAENWRFGLEGSYSGRQYRDGDSRTPSYLFMALMAERKFGKKMGVVLNCENLLDYRQSKHEALYTGSLLNPSFKPLWAPIDGRILNLSLKWNFAGK